MPKKKYAVKFANPLDNYRPLNLHRWSKSPEADSTVDFIFAEMDEKGLIKDGQKKPKVEAKLKKHLKLVILDLYCTYCADPERWIGYHRNANQYSALGYKKLDISYSPLITVIDWLSPDYIDDKIGFIYWDTGRGRISRMRARPKLIELFKAKGIKLRQIEPNPNAEVIILRNKDGEDKSYKDRPELQSMRKNVQAYNQLLSKCLIDFNETDAKENPAIDKTRKFVRRIFNKDFEHGGRYFGVWWLNVKRSHRRYIQINGKSADEFDYGYLHVALLYASKGEDFYTKGIDPYRIDIGYGLDDDLSRDLVKSIFLFALNAGDDKSCLRAMNSEIRKNPNRYPPYKEIQPRLKGILAKIKANHPAIADAFNSGIGLKLQNIDSQIATEVINRMTKIRQPILCVHDSFLASRKNTPLVLKAMQESYSKVAGTLSLSSKIKTKLSKATHLAIRVNDEIFMLPEPKPGSWDTPTGKRLSIFNKTGNTLPFD